MGVLHHTAAMGLGIENTLTCVSPNSAVATALYNDQGSAISYLVDDQIVLQQLTQSAK